MKIRPSVFVFLAVLTAVLSTRAIQAVRPAPLVQLVQAIPTVRPIPTFQAFQPGDSAPHRALIDRYCVSCHSDRVKTAGLTLEKRDLGRVPEDAEVWEKALRKLRGGMMP